MQLKVTIFNQDSQNGDIIYISDNLCQINLGTITTTLERDSVGVKLF